MVNVLLPFPNDQCAVTIPEWSMCCYHSRMVNVLLPFQNGQCDVTIPEWSTCCYHSRMVNVQLPFKNGQCAVTIPEWSMCCYHSRIVNVLLPFQNGQCSVTIPEWSTCCYHSRMVNVLLPFQNGQCVVTILEWSMYCYILEWSKYCCQYRMIDVLVLLPFQNGQCTVTFPSKDSMYYSICFLNQLMLSKEDKLLAAKLVTVYFSFFKSFVKKGEVDSKMMSALLTGVNRSYPYAAVDPEYLSEQLHNIYKLVHVVNFNTSLQALMLLYQVMDSSETVSDRYYTALYKKMSDPNLKSSSKQSMFLNLLFKSIKKDTVDRRTKAFIKRLLQICSSQPAQFVCGALVLLGELVKLKPAVIVGKHMSEESDDDEDEHFTDLPDPDSDSGTKEKQSYTTVKQNPSSWDHKSNDKNKTSHYDPHHRNPLYCNAENECIWELKQLKNHFHPTVSLFASNLIKGEPVTYTGNPLEDFTTIRFLDRFVYKNPKKRDALPQTSMTVTKHNKLSAKGIKSIPVNSEKYLENAEDNIPAEELFYYRYFSQKAARKKTDDDDNMSETESVSDGEFDAYLDDYEKNLEPGHFDEDDYDFASEVKKKMKKKIAEDVDNDDSDDDEEEDEEDFSDEEVDFEGDEDFANAFKEYDEDMIDEENIEFSDDGKMMRFICSSRRGKIKFLCKTEEIKFKWRNFQVKDLIRSLNSHKCYLIHFNSANIKQLKWGSRQGQEDETNSAN
ncbi:MAK21 [Mytilus coruscus]|uniref:MAK21 n=1 Tax=Mytilus coruscus TaxID=42192 RepID=A0A6J8B3D2_MYTCO|nr:MAK21 [Mytilus coruscus]